MLIAVISSSKNLSIFHFLLCMVFVKLIPFEPITIISTTKTKLIVEITNQGACNMLKHFNEALEEGVK